MDMVFAGFGNILVHSRATCLLLKALRCSLSFCAGGYGIWFCFGRLLLLSLLLSMLGCMDAQGVLVQNITIPPIQTVC